MTGSSIILKAFGSITPMEAFMDLGITKLATRVSEMRRLGFEFDQKMEESTNRYGEIVRYMRYSLPCKEQRDLFA